MIKMLILVSIPICLLEGIPLYRQRRWKELIVTGVLIVFAFVLGIGKAVGWVTPVELLTRWLYPVGEAIFKHF